MNRDENLAKWLKKSLPSAEETEVTSRRVFDQLLSLEDGDLQKHSQDMAADGLRGKRPKLYPALATSAAIAAIVFGTAVYRQSVATRAQALARIENSGRSVYGEVVQSRTPEGTTLVLSDGSRVEMRSQSEVHLERADDGVRIDLTRGSIIVAAARQHSGHLYVRTKDVTVSVVGTVFLVNAEETGSRVAVIQGEVRVQEGAAETRLRPGEAIETNPLISLPPMSEELAWSRNAAAHMTLLQQSIALLRQRVPAPPLPAETPAEAGDRFEVISIKPSDPAVLAGRGGAGGRGGPGGGASPLGPAYCGGPIQLNPGRLVLGSVTLFRLIATAYGKNCRAAGEIGLITRMPDWARSDSFDIQATLPPGSPSYTPQQLFNGEAPKLQAMLQNMLSERFSLTFHRESKEVNLYNLILVRPGRIILSDDQTPPVPQAPQPGPPPRRDPNAPITLPRGAFSLGVDPPAGKVMLGARAIPLSTMINIFQGQEARLVIDKTGMKGLYDIPQQTIDVGPFDIGPNAVSVWPEIMRAIGLKLEPARGPAEVLVIEHAEKPVEN